MTTYPQVNFGDVTFTKNDIIRASIIESFDPYSLTVPIGELELELFSDNAQFSILNPTGNYETLKYLRPLVVHEFVDGKAVFLGVFYLENWENVDENIIKFKCIDIIGLLDISPQYGGIWLTSVTVADLIEDILGPVGINYAINPTVAAVELTGWLPICSRRVALQQVAFAAGAYVQSSRQSGFIKIGYAYTNEKAVSKGPRVGVGRVGQSRVYQKRWRPFSWDIDVPDIVLTDADQKISSPIDLKTQVTGVQVVMHDISPGEGQKTIFDGVLSAGEHRITFNQPMHTITLDGADFVELGANYIIINVIVEGEVHITGYVYVEKASVVGKYALEGTYDQENIIKIEDGTLVNSNNGNAIAERVYNYYQKRLVRKTTLFAPMDVKPGSEVIVDVEFDQQISGVVEKMSLDLTGGFLAETTIVGELV